LIEARVAWPGDAVVGGERRASSPKKVELGDFWLDRFGARGLLLVTTLVAMRVFKPLRFGRFEGSGSASAKRATR
jgi:hypothetical protein